MGKRCSLGLRSSRCSAGKANTSKRRCRPSRSSPPGEGDPPGARRGPGEQADSPEAEHLGGYRAYPHGQHPPQARRTLAAAGSGLRGRRLCRYTLEPSKTISRVYVQISGALSVQPHWARKSYPLLVRRELRRGGYHRSMSGTRILVPWHFLVLMPRLYRPGAQRLQAARRGQRERPQTDRDDIVTILCCALSSPWRCRSPLSSPSASGRCWCAGWRSSRQRPPASFGVSAVRARKPQNTV